MLVLMHVWLIYIFQNILKIFSKLKKNLFLIHFRPFRSTGRSTVVVSGQHGRPASWPSLMAMGVHVCRSTGPVDRQTLRSTDRSTDCMTLAFGFCRSTGPVNRQFIFLFLKWPRSIVRSTGANGSFAKWLVGRPAGRPAAIQIALTAIFWICFIFYGFQRLFLVSKWLNSSLMTW